MFFKRMAAIVIGATISAFGITLALGAGYGSATLAVLWEGMTVTFGVTTGVASLIIAALMLVFVAFYDRRQIRIGTIVYQIVYSTALDVFKAIIHYPESKLLCFLIMLAAIVIFATGNGLYASARLGRGSYEALTYALVERNRWSVQVVRMALDLSFVVLGWLLGGHFGVCTVCTILLSGPVMQRAAAFFTRIFHFDQPYGLHFSMKGAVKEQTIVFNRSPFLHAFYACFEKKTKGPLPHKNAEKQTYAAWRFFCCLAKYLYRL